MKVSVILSCILFSVNVPLLSRANASQASSDTTSKSEIVSPSSEFDNGMQSTLSPPALSKRPTTTSDLVSNLLYIIKHDLAFRPDFYSDKSLEKLLGASAIQGERGSSEIALTVQLFAKAETSRTGNPRPWIANALIRRDHNEMASIQVQINDPAMRAPYEAVQRILGTAWRPWHPNVPTPHARYVPPSAPHGNDSMVLHIGSQLANYTVEADFDPAGKLHHFSVSIHPTPGRNPS